MPISLNDIEVLRAKIEADRKKLKQQEEALRVLEEMVAGSEGKSQSASTPGTLPPILNPRKSLKGNIEEIVKDFADQEFTVAHVESSLKQRGQLPNSRSPRASIAMALSSLESKGVVERTYKGVGSEPHRFKYCGQKSSNGFKFD